MKLSIGNSDFKDVRERRCDFIDKTLFIREVLQDETVAFLITRPRRFGKTFNMSLLRYFFDARGAKENRSLFEDTLIAKATLEDGRSCMDFQGKYPVLFITLKNVRAQNYDGMYSTIANTIGDLYSQHRYLLEGEILTAEEKKVYREIIQEKSNERSLQVSLKKLTEYLNRYYGKKVIVLMDEYDTPMHSAFEAKDPYHEELLPFMREFMSVAFKDNEHLQKGILTGILRVSLMNMFSGMNSIPAYTMLSLEYASYFGFTEEEITEVLGKINFECNQEAMKNWYNGYK